MSNLICTYGNALRAARYSGETITDRCCWLRTADTRLPYGLEQAIEPELEELLAQSNAAWTLYTRWYHLAGFYRWADGRHLSHDPMRGMAPPKPPQCFAHPATEDQLATALARLPEPYRRAVLLAAFQGLRAGEIARLAREDVTARRMVVQRKGGKTQILPTYPMAWEEISSLPAGPVVRRPRGGHFQPDRLSWSVSRHLTAIGLEELTLHWFRHRFATIALRPKEFGGAGADIRTVQELMGHASLASTQIYTQVTEVQLRAAVVDLPMPPVQ